MDTLDKIDMYLNERKKIANPHARRRIAKEKENNETYKIETKGITHDWLVDKPYDKTTNLSKKEAEKIVKKAIKAGRKPDTIRMVKE